MTTPVNQGKDKMFEKINEYLEQFRETAKEYLKRREEEMNNEDTEDLDELVQDVLTQLRQSGIVPGKIDAYYERIGYDVYPHITIYFNDGTQKEVPKPEEPK
jgi:vacuolar-type H+-ATPase subunit E/Vma4